MTFSLSMIGATLDGIFTPPIESLAPSNQAPPLPIMTFPTAPTTTSCPPPALSAVAPPNHNKAIMITGGIIIGLIVLMRIGPPHAP